MADACGENAEVYSRITGYYRPVQNWNDGKREEYEERKEYDIASSVMKHGNACACEKKETAPIKEEKGTENAIILFATKTCPNCKMSAAMLDKAGIGYVKVYAEDNKDKVAEYGIVQAPTLVVIKDGEVVKYQNASNIKKFIESIKG